MTRDELRTQSLTQNPIVLFQERREVTVERDEAKCPWCGTPLPTCHGCGRSLESDTVDTWVTTRVFADPDEVEAWRSPQKYRYPDGEERKTWRTYVVPCAGSLAKLLDDAGKASAYYLTAVLQHSMKPCPRPPFVPTKVRLRRQVAGDPPIGASVSAPPGVYACTANRLGAVSITTPDGARLGLRLDEFEVLEWVENPEAGE